MDKHTISTKRLVLAAMLAALTAAGSALRITIPVNIAGTTSFHLGNILCALCGILLGPWLGGVAAGLGSAIYDLFNPLYAPECWITFLTKAVYGVAAGLVARAGQKGNALYAPSYLRSLAATATGAVAYALLYLAKGLFYDGVLLQGLAPAVAAAALTVKLPATVFNACVAIVAAPLLATVLCKALQKAHYQI